MDGNNFFKRKTPEERLAEKKKVKLDKITKCKEKYEGGRTREFKAEWKTNRDWLHYTTLLNLYPNSADKVSKTLLEIKSERTKNGEGKGADGEIEDVMVCIPCREKYYSNNKLSMDKYVPTKADFNKNPYIFGSISFRIHAIEKHSANTSTFHNLAVTRKSNLNAEKGGSSESSHNNQPTAKTALLMLNETQRTRLKHLFINTYALMVKGRPYSGYEHYIAIDKAKGVDVGTTYLNHKKAMEFSIAITQCEILELQTLFNKCKFFSLVMDESTDVYRLEQCISFIRFSIRGEIYTRFLDVISVVRPNAEQITECIFKMMERNLNWIPPKEENILSDDQFTQHLQGNFESDDEDEEITREDEGNETTDHEVHDIIEEEEDYEEICNAFEDNTSPKISESLSPLLVSITTDGANVLKGKRTGVSARLRARCNKMMLNSHCVSHRCQLELKTTGKKCKLCKEVNQFLEKLYVFHKISNVVTNTFRESVAKLNVPGAVSVIRVNGTRWVSHTLNALKNLLNGIQAHLHAYNKLIGLETYSGSQKEKARYFIKHLKDKKFLSFMIFMHDVLESASVFSKVSQGRQTSISEMEDVLQLLLSNLDRFIIDPDSGKLWKSRNEFGINGPEDEISKDYRKKFTSTLKENVEARCGSDFPPVFYEAMELINPNKSKHDDIFTYDASSRNIFAKRF